MKQMKTFSTDIRNISVAINDFILNEEVKSIYELVLVKDVYVLYYDDGDQFPRL